MLLVLATLVVSVGLLNLPVRVAENEVNATGMIDTSRYAVLELDSDFYEWEIDRFVDANPYAMLVLTADCERLITEDSDDWYLGDAYITESLVIDLNGHTFDAGYRPVYFQAHHLWVTDSSAAGNGKMVGSTLYINEHERDFETIEFVVERGTVDFENGVHIYGYDEEEEGYWVNAYLYDGAILGDGIYFENYYEAYFGMTGGYLSAISYDRYCDGNLDIDFGKYVFDDSSVEYFGCWRQYASEVRFDPIGWIDEEFYAVSNSEYYTGAYNDVYGYLWEKTRDEMEVLAVDPSQTYYLWFRDEDEWYQCASDLRYINGKLVMV